MKPVRDHVNDHLELHAHGHLFEHAKVKTLAGFGIASRYKCKFNQSSRTATDISDKSTLATSGAFDAGREAYRRGGGGCCANENEELLCATAV